MLQAKQAANLESQRRGRRPGSGDDGPGTKDSGGQTGGYSYDSGGRKVLVTVYNGKGNRSIYKTWKRIQTTRR
jgi:hypothetical protein